MTTSCAVEVFVASEGLAWPTSTAIFGATIRASVALVRAIQPALPLLTRSPIGQTGLLAQFSARPWKLESNLVLTEPRGFKCSPSLDEALNSSVRGPKPSGRPRRHPCRAGSFARCVTR